MNSATIQMGIQSCDERIEEVEAKVLRAMVRGLFYLIDGEDFDKEKSIANYKHNIIILKTEKLIYQSLLKTNNNRIFPLLYAKYCEQVAESLEKGETWFESEQDYLVYAKKTKEQMSYIEKLCIYGKKR
jgi:hypothetical protein